MLSVIIPTYNARLLIGRTLESVLGQRGIGRADLEIIVVDDASTDGTPDVVAGYAAKDDRIRVFRETVNRGPAACRNIGLREARGELAAFLDGDDYWEADFLAVCSGFLADHPEAIAVSVMQRHRIIGKPESVSPRIDEDMDAAGSVLDDYYRFWAKYRHVCTGSAMFRTAVAREVGGQREDLRVCEDLEFWALLATRGKWGFVPQILFTSDGGDTTKAQGWLAKNMKRWQSAPAVEEWSRRILAALPSECKSGFAVCQAQIAKNLSYSMIQSDRDAEARRTVLKYGGGPEWRQSAMHRIMRFAAVTPLSWKLLCVLLRRRERRRRI